AEPSPSANGARASAMLRGPLPARPECISGVFLIWTARNPLKSPESDEGIQDNPSPLSWSGLVRIWFGLEKFGLRRRPFPWRRRRRSKLRGLGERAIP